MHEVRPQREHLIRDIAARDSAVTHCCREHFPVVLRAVLIVVGRVDLRAWDARALEGRIWQTQELGQAEPRGDTVFDGLRLVGNAVLEVAAEGQIEPLSAVEEVLMVVTHLRREAQQAGGVGAAFSLHLDAPYGRLRQLYAAIHDVGVRRRHLHLHAAENPDIGDAGVSVGDVGFGINVPRMYGDEVPERLWPERQCFRLGDGHLADAVAAERPGGGGSFVAGVFPYPVDEVGGAVGQRVRLEGEVVAAQVEVAEVAKTVRAAGGFGLEHLFRQPLALHCGAGGKGVGVEVFCEITPLGDVVAHRAHTVAASGLDVIGHISSAALIGSSACDL